LLYPRYTTRRFVIWGVVRFYLQDPSNSNCQAIERKTGEDLLGLSPLFTTASQARQRSTETGASQRAFSIDQQRKVILYFGARLTLSRYEFRLLEILASSPGRVYSRAQLMETAWEEPEASMERTVDAHIKSLRSKLRQLRPEIDAIRTHRGFGYSLLEEL
jgi:two-component system catabolic regulation response regulator CreB